VELIQDGGFEQGASGPWVQYSSGGYELIGAGVGYGESWGACLGGYDNLNESLSQYLDVPADTIAASNTLKVYMYTTELGAGVYDTLTMTLSDTEGNPLATFAVYDNTKTAYTWVTMVSPDLASYRGQRLLYTIRASTDDSLATSFYVDDVSFTVQVP